MEQWKEIFPDYLVSTLGNVDSLKHGKRHRLAQRIKNNGYLQVGIRVDGKQKYFCVHRLVAMAFIPNADGKPQINHINGIKTDNCVENLEWCTQSENQVHALKNGLRVARQNEDAFGAKLTNEQVIYIRNNPDGLTMKQLAKKFGVQRTTVGEVQLGNHFKTVGGKIRDRIDKRVPDAVRKQIRTEYVKGQRGYGSTALAKKFGLGKTTVKQILKEKD